MSTITLTEGQFQQLLTAFTETLSKTNVVGFAEPEVEVKVVQQPQSAAPSRRQPSAGVETLAFDLKVGQNFRLTADSKATYTVVEMGSNGLKAAQTIRSDGQSVAEGNVYDVKYFRSTGSGRKARTSSRVVFVVR